MTNKELGITQIQRNNLNKLADYLERGKLKVKFDMMQWAAHPSDYFHTKRKPDNRSEYSHDGWTDCGTVGCAVGHGPFAGISKTVNEDWREYSFRVFGGVRNKRHKITRLWWDFCFNGGWAKSDNTPQGAAERIRYVLKHGVPRDFEIAYGSNLLFPTTYKAK